MSQSTDSQPFEAPPGGARPAEPFERLLRDLERSRRGAGRLVRRDPHALLGLLGLVLACGGVGVILLAWSGVAHSRYIQQELAYAVSGGLGGLALVVIGSALYLGYVLVRHQRTLTAAIREGHVAPAAPAGAAPPGPEPSVAAGTTLAAPGPAGDEMVSTNGTRRRRNAVV